MKKGEVSEIVTSWNIQAMKFLKLGNPFSAFNLLQKASKLLASHKSLIDLHMVTLNNLGCYYKWVKKPKEALKQFESSAYLRKNYSVEPVGLAGTFLNISSLHSDMGNHNLALKFSQDAVDLLKTGDQNSCKLKMTLAMAYHSLANEFSNLKNFKEAFENFEKSLNVASETPGSAKLTDFIKGSLKKVEKKIGNDGKSVGSGRDLRIFREKKEKIEKNEKNEEEKIVSFESKKLPFIQKYTGRERYTPGLNQGSTRCRFITGDRLKPMFPQSVSPVNDRSYVDETLENIQNKIDLLESRLEVFHKEIEPLRALEVQDMDESFSPRSLEFFKEFKTRNNAARVIQRKFRKFTTVREKTA
jgi:tetratricopeptide (TPR) repeat protein